MSNPASLILIVTAAVLLYAAVTDLRDFQIPNQLIWILIILWIVHVVAHQQWLGFYWNVAFAAILFVCMLYFYGRNWMGGGDVKLASVAFLWTGIDCALVFAVLLLGFAIIHTVAARLGWVEVRRAKNG